MSNVRIVAFAGSLRSGSFNKKLIRIAAAGARAAGPLGAPLQPDFTPSSPLVSRMYGLHVSVLPLVLTSLLALHLWLIRHLG